MTKEHVWERPDVWGATVHSTLCVRSQRGAARRRTASVEVDWGVLVARTLDWSRRLAWAGALGWPGVWEVAVGLPWARSRRWGRHFHHGSRGWRTRTRIRYGGRRMAAIRHDLLGHRSQWHAMGCVPAVAQVFLLAYGTITNLNIRRCEPWWSASPETIRDYGP